MRKINNRQYKLNQIRQKTFSIKMKIGARRGARFTSRLDRRGNK